MRRFLGQGFIPLFIAGIDQPLIGHGDCRGSSVQPSSTFVQQQCLVTMLQNLRAAVGDQKDGCTVFFKFLEVAITFFLKKFIANGKCFVNNQQIWVDVRLNGKCKAHNHAT